MSVSILCCSCFCFASIAANLRSSSIRLRSSSLRLARSFSNSKDDIFELGFVIVLNFGVEAINVLFLSYAEQFKLLFSASTSCFSVTAGETSMSIISQISLSDFSEIFLFDLEKFTNVSLNEKTIFYDFGYLFIVEWECLCRNN